MPFVSIYFFYNNIFVAISFISQDAKCIWEAEELSPIECQQKNLSLTLAEKFILSLFHTFVVTTLLISTFCHNFVLKKKIVSGIFILLILLYFTKQNSFLNFVMNSIGENNLILDFNAVLNLSHHFRDNDFISHNMYTPI